MMTSPKNQSNKKRQAGLTLIEVLVVLLIIVVGILSVVQLFPSGFGVMRAADNVSEATRLGQLELESMKQNGTPSGVYAGVEDTSQGQNVFDPTIPPTDLTTVTNIAGLGQPATPPAFSDVNKIRYIKNETFTIAGTQSYVNSSGQSVNQPIHVLNFGPVYISQPTNPTPDVVVATAPWTAIKGNSAPDYSRGIDPTTGGYDPIDNPTDTLKPGVPSYMIDYANMELAMAQEAYNQTFIFTVGTGSSNSINSGTTTTTATTTATVIINLAGTSATTPYQGQWFTLSQPSPGVTVTFGTAGSSQGSIQSAIETAWQNGSASIYVQFSYKAYPFDANNPYEFNLNEANTSGAVNPMIGPSQSFNVGVLAFNPALAASLGAQSMTVQASYTVYDWHVIHEDHDLPLVQTATTTGTTGSTSGTTGSTTGSTTGATFTGATTAIRLAINDIQEVGDVQAFGTTPTGTIVAGQPSTGVIAGDNIAAEQYDFIFLNMDDGAMSIAYTHSEINDDDTNPGNTSPNLIHVSFHNGRLVVPSPLLDSLGVPIQHLRIFYRGSADWAVALRRAPAQYVSVNQIPGLTGTAPYFNNPSALRPEATGVAIASVPVTPNLYYYQDTALNGGGTTNTIYFPLCDLGKQITLTNVQVTMSSGGSTQTVTVPSVELTQLTSSNGVVSESLAGETPIVNAISTLDGELGVATGTTVPFTLTIGAVSGVSAQAVVIWRDRDIWKEQTLDTVLPPTA